MNTKNNQLHNETEKRIREALFTFIDRGQTPTVSGICEAAAINRATFYRHYQDVPDLMEKIRSRIFSELKDGFSTFTAEDYISRESLQLLVRHMDCNRAFFRMYLSMTDVTQADNEQIWESFFRPLFEAHGVRSESHMKYYHCFYMAGFIAVLRRWLESGSETADEIADILWRYSDRMAQQE